jgi:dTDP-4-amino-4,6-dideoxygalactose transaminase
VECKGGAIVRGHILNKPNHHLFAIVFKTPDQRDRYIAFMRGHRIVAPFHYVALHQSEMGRRFHDGRVIPESERLTACLVRLPLYFNMTEAEQDEVIGRTREFLDAI